jgi:hypothetical protein
MLISKISQNPKRIFQLLVNCYDLILNFKVHVTIFPGCQNQLQTWKYEVPAIPSLDAKVMSYFIFIVNFEESLDAAMWLKLPKGWRVGYPKKKFV